MAAQSVAIKLEAGKLVLEDKNIERLEVHQQLGDHCYCTAQFSFDYRTDVALESLLGKDARVTIDGPGGPVTVFEGIVNRGSQSPHHHGGSTVSIEAISNSVRLEYCNTAYFPKMDLVSIAGALGARVVGSASNATKLDYLQFGESDFAFLLRMAEEHGLFVQTSGAQPELHSKFVDDNPCNLTWGGDLLNLTVAAAAVNTGFKGSYYEMEQKTEHRFHGVRRTPTWLGDGSPLLNHLSDLAETYGGGGDAQVEEFTARSRLLADYREALEAKSERLLGNAMQIEGTSLNPALRAGNACILSDGGDKELPKGFDGKVGLISVTHYWGGESYLNRFVATRWAAFTTVRRSPRKLIPGLVTAEVMENEDPERAGRIRVRYHWQERDGEKTRWIRVATIHAGHQRGVMFVPEIGDEVLVGFEQGDPERPVVLGALWNGKDQSPSAGRNNATKEVVTRSGNTLRFVDTHDKELIELYTPQATCFLQLTNDAKGKPLVTIRSGGDISLEAEGEIRLRCESLTQWIQKDAGRYVSGNDTIEVGKDAVCKANGKHAVQALEVVANASGNLTAIAGGVANLSGATVQIQPPGLVAPPVNVNRPSQIDTVWAKRPVPKAPEKLQSTSDQEASRS